MGDDYRYTVTATGPDGKPLPGAVITLEPPIPGVNVTCWDCLGWWRQECCTTCHPRAFVPPLCINGHAYRKRQLARRRRK